jgi:hypothetical protein
MTSPILKNERTYNVFVPSPSGTSVKVPPGHYIAGTYFNTYYKASRELTLLPPDTVIPEKLLVCSYDRVTVVKQESTVTETVVDTRKEVALADLPVTVPDRVANIIAEPPVKNKGGRPKKTIAESTQEMADMWNGVTTVLPAANEVDKLSTSALEKLAKKLSVSPALPRKELVESIKSKLG